LLQSSLHSRCRGARPVMGCAGRRARRRHRPPHRPTRRPSHQRHGRRARASLRVQGADDSAAAAGDIRRRQHRHRDLHPLGSDGRGDHVAGHSRLLVLAHDFAGLRHSAETTMKRRPVADVAVLSDHAFSHHAPIWWGNLLMIFIEAAAFALLAASYFYIRRNFDTWPPPRTLLPDLGVSSINLLLLILSVLPFWYAARLAFRHASPGP